MTKDFQIDPAFGQRKVRKARISHRNLLKAIAGEILDSGGITSGDYDSRAIVDDVRKELARLGAENFPLEREVLVEERNEALTKAATWQAAHEGCASKLRDEISANVTMSNQIERVRALVEQYGDLYKGLEDSLIAILGAIEPPPQCSICRGYHGLEVIHPCE